MAQADHDNRCAEADIIGSGNQDLQCRLDRTVLTLVAEEIARFIDSTGKILVGIPVHFDTLAARTRRIEFLSACRSIPHNARHLVVFDLIHSPPGVPPSRLQEMCSELRQYSRALIASVPLQLRDFTPFVSAGFHSVGVDLSANRTPEPVLIEQMRQFAAAADNGRLTAFVHGLRSTSLASSAVAAGFRYIGGASVHSIVDGLQQLRRYGAADLYGSLFTQARSPYPSERGGK